MGEERAGQERVGLVGLGTLGLPMAALLVDAGLPPVVHDVRADAVQQAVDGGARGARDAAEVAAGADVLLVCVQTDEQCVEVVAGDRGLLTAARPGSVIAILSTVHPDTITVLAAAAVECAVQLVDCPLAGKGEGGLRDRTMWAMAGGDPDAIDRLRPALGAFTGRVLSSGPLGSGAALKLAHNVMVYVSYLATFEAAELARAAGVADGMLADVTRATGALSPQSDLFLQILELRRDEPDGFLPNGAFETSSALLEKDLRHACGLAAEHGLELPGAALTRTMGDALYQVRRGDGAGGGPTVTA
jgi:3-hydroxyisobutyrate dehydrogenase-like beta-hydroxyacid dehydrogenase